MFVCKSFNFDSQLIADIHCVSKKLSHFVIVYIFVKYWPIFKIFSLAHFADK